MIKTTIIKGVEGAKLALAKARAEREEAEAAFQKARNRVSLAQAELRIAQRNLEKAFTRERTSAIARARRQCKALAERYDIVVEPENFGNVHEPNWHYWVYPKPSFPGMAEGWDDPYDGEQCRDDWVDALDLVRHYALIAATGIDFRD